MVAQVPPAPAAPGLPAPVSPIIQTNNTIQWANIQTAVSNTAEPARNIARITAVVGAAALILAGVGLHINSETQNALVTLGVVFLPTIIALGEVIRSKVVPISKANAMLDASYKIVPTQGTNAPQV